MFSSFHCQGKLWHRPDSSWAVGIGRRTLRPRLDFCGKCLTVSSKREDLNEKDEGTAELSRSHLSKEVGKEGKRRLAAATTHARTERRRRRETHGKTEERHLKKEAFKSFVASVFPCVHFPGLL